MALMNPLRNLVALLLLCCASRLVAAQQEPLKAEVSWPGGTVKIAENFSLTVVLKSTGSSERSLTIWTCPVSEQWLPDNPVVQLIQVTPCQQPALGVIRIRPGDKYKETVTLSIRLPSDGTISNNVTFRLGFSERTRISDIEVPKTPSLWSNAVTISVTR
jgi:hypothetical protein